MLKLFKAKSLKNNTKTGQGVGAGAGVQSSDNKNAQKQGGRSMVEMLGVLAIIGVLSIGGISGYTIAMRRYRANEIVDVMNKYAAILYTHCQMKMKNDPINYSNLDHCNFDPQSSDPYAVKLLSFTDAGLGSLPNGVLDVSSNNFTDGYDGYGSYFFYNDASHDLVEISILLNDQKLCEVISDMMNEKERDGQSSDWPTPCQEKTVSGVKGYPAHLAFYVS